MSGCLLLGNFLGRGCSLLSWGSLSSSCRFLCSSSVFLESSLLLKHHGSQLSWVYILGLLRDVLLFGLFLCALSTCTIRCFNLHTKLSLDCLGVFFIKNMQ